MLGHSGIGPNISKIIGPKIPKKFRAAYTYRLAIGQRCKLKNEFTFMLSKELSVRLSTDNECHIYMSVANRRRCTCDFHSCTFRFRQTKTETEFLRVYCKKKFSVILLITKALAQLKSRRIRYYPITLQTVTCHLEISHFCFSIVITCHR